MRTVLRRLEEKGYVTHTVEGRTYVFSAAEARRRSRPARSRESSTGSATGRSRKCWLGMVDARMLDRKTLQRLARRIEQAKRDKGEK